MKTFDVNQVMIIMGWTRPTAYSFMKRAGGYIAENGNNPQKWVIDNKSVLNAITDQKQTAQAKEERYRREMLQGAIES